MQDVYKRNIYMYRCHRNTIIGYAWLNWECMADMCAYNNHTIHGHYIKQVELYLYLLLNHHNLSDNIVYNTQINTHTYSYWHTYHIILEPCWSPLPSPVNYELTLHLHHYDLICTFKCRIFIGSLVAPLVYNKPILSIIMMYM